MRYRKLFLTPLICLFIFQNCNGQQNSKSTAAKNIVHASIGTFVVPYSAHLGYERLLASKNGFFKSYYASLKLGGITAIDFSGYNGGTGQTANIGVTGLSGDENNHFELGLGLGYYRDTIFSENDPDDSTFYPHLTVGYRLQKSMGLMFRTGVGIPEYAYVGIGYSF